MSEVDRAEGLSTSDRSLDLSLHLFFLQKKRWQCGQSWGWIIKGLNVTAYGKIKEILARKGSVI